MKFTGMTLVVLVYLTVLLGQKGNSVPVAEVAQMQRDLIVAKEEVAKQAQIIENQSQVIESLSNWQQRAMDQDFIHLQELRQEK